MKMIQMGHNTHRTRSKATRFSPPLKKKIPQLNNPTNHTTPLTSQQTIFPEEKKVNGQRPAFPLGPDPPRNHLLRPGRRRRHRLRRGGAVLPAAGSDGDIAEGAAGGPVAVAGLAEVAGLVDVVVVEVAELGLLALAPRARQRPRAPRGCRSC